MERSLILDLFDAIEVNSIFPDAPKAALLRLAHLENYASGQPLRLGDQEKDPLDRKIVSREEAWTGSPARSSRAPRSMAARLHFYMETQACIADAPDEPAHLSGPPRRAPMEMHQTTAMALGMQYHRIDVQVPPVGGGFGGKTEQTRFVVGPAAVAAHATKRPVRLAVPREEDTAMIGKRHAYYGQYQIAIDRGDVQSEGQGHHPRLPDQDVGRRRRVLRLLVHRLELHPAARRQRLPDRQLPEPDRRLPHQHRAEHRVPRFRRRPGQELMLENAMDDAAFSLGMLPEDVREKNLYERGDVTPFGQALSLLLHQSRSGPT